MAAAELSRKVARRENAVVLGDAGEADAREATPDPLCLSNRNLKIYCLAQKLKKLVTTIEIFLTSPYLHCKITFWKSRNDDH